MQDHSRFGTPFAALKHQPLEQTLHCIGGADCRQRK